MDSSNVMKQYTSEKIIKEKRLKRMQITNTFRKYWLFLNSGYAK